jgi:Invasion associated locus B (IalB) protein
MTSWMTRASVAAALTLVAPMLVPTPTLAQESTNRVATKTDWSVFTEDKPSKECWGVSSPKESVNTKDGKSVAVKRSDILLFITFRPGQAAGEVSFTGGYTFAKDSKIDVDVGGTKYQMFSDGEWAWTSGPDDDAKLMTALKAGSEATLTAHSAKGTQTKDTFSLSGFSAAMTEAASRCK